MLQGITQDDMCCRSVLMSRLWSCGRCRSCPVPLCPGLTSQQWTVGNRRTRPGRAFRRVPGRHPSRHPSRHPVRHCFHQVAVASAPSVSVKSVCGPTDVCAAAKECGWTAPGAVPGATTAHRLTVAAAAVAVAVADGGCEALGPQPRSDQTQLVDIQVDIDTKYGLTFREAAALHGLATNGHDATIQSGQKKMQPPQTGKDRKVRNSSNVQTGRA